MERKNHKQKKTYYKYNKIKEPKSQIIKKE